MKFEFTPDRMLTSPIRLTERMIKLGASIVRQAHIAGEQTVSQFTKQHTVQNAKALRQKIKMEEGLVDDLQARLDCIPPELPRGPFIDLPALEQHYHESNDSNMEARTNNS